MDKETLCRFRNALIRTGLDKKPLGPVNARFEKSGLLVCDRAIVDATVVQSARKPKKRVELLPEDRREDELPESSPANRISYSDDEEAGWIKKMGASTYGFKEHVMVDAKHGFYLGSHATAANRFDGKELERRLAENRLEDEATIFADKTYWSAENQGLLADRRYLDGDETGRKR